MKIKFIKSPTGSFKLAYNKGAEVDATPTGISASQCKELIEAGVAVEVPTEKASKEIKKDKPKAKMSSK